MANLPQVHEISSDVMDWLRRPPFHPLVHQTSQSLQEWGWRRIYICQRFIWNITTTHSGHGVRLVSHTSTSFSSLREYSNWLIGRCAHYAEASAQHPILQFSQQSNVFTSSTKSIAATHSSNARRWHQLIDICPTSPNADELWSLSVYDSLSDSCCKWSCSGSCNTYTQTHQTICFSTDSIVISTQMISHLCWNWPWSSQCIHVWGCTWSSGHQTCYPRRDWPEHTIQLWYLTLEYHSSQERQCRLVEWPRCQAKAEQYLNIIGHWAWKVGWLPAEEKSRIWEEIPRQQWKPLLRTSDASRWWW